MDDVCRAQVVRVPAWQIAQHMWAAATYAPLATALLRYSVAACTCMQEVSLILKVMSDRLGVLAVVVRGSAVVKFVSIHGSQVAGSLGFAPKRRSGARSLPRSGVPVPATLKSNVRLYSWKRCQMWDCTASASCCMAAAGGRAHRNSAAALQ